MKRLIFILITLALETVSFGLIILLLLRVPALTLLFGVVAG